MKLMQKQLNEQPKKPSKLNSKVSAGAEAIILTMLAKDASDRYSSWQDLFNHIEQVKTGEMAGTAVPVDESYVDPSTAPTETRLPDNQAAIEAEAERLKPKNSQLPLFIGIGVVILIIVLVVALK